MTLHLTVGEPVSRASHNNKYELVTTGMSGDGDQYNNHSSFFSATDKGLEDLERTIRIMLVLADVPSGYHNEKKYMQPVYDFAKSKYGMDHKTTSNLLWDLVGSDVTCEGHRAQLEDHELFFWDANGVKRHASFELSE